MEDVAGAEGYARADFEEAHSRVIDLFDAVFSGIEITGTVLDLGCGPGDVTFRFSRRFPEASFVAVDGSAAMIALARERRERSAAGANISFIETSLSGEAVPRRVYDAIISTSSTSITCMTPLSCGKQSCATPCPGQKYLSMICFGPGTGNRRQTWLNIIRAGSRRCSDGTFTTLCSRHLSRPRSRISLFVCGLGALSVRAVSDRHMIVFGEKSRRASP